MTPLITANQLEEIINSGENVLICDCRFDLVDPLAGRKSYLEGHIPGALYLAQKQEAMAVTPYPPLRFGRKPKLA
jgi:thiosulfate/3-mercaptopyruvate sulfurtransferase